VHLGTHFLSGGDQERQYLSDMFEFAIYPLTVFDKLTSPSSFVTGWLVEGSIDKETLVGPLTRLTDKWRMLAGRLESVKKRHQVSGIVYIRSTTE
jgi:hypothetical protein